MNPTKKLKKNVQFYEQLEGHTHTHHHKLYYYVFLHGCINQSLNVICVTTSSSSLLKDRFHKCFTLPTFSGFYEMNSLMLISFLAESYMR